MNEEQIRQMEAGRELDAMVGAKVFEIDKWCPDGEGEFDLICTCECGPPRTWHARQPLPHFSTDIAAAWEVVERLYDEHWIVGIGSLAENPRGWRCELCNMWPDDFERAPTDIEANGDTAPLAICRAALLAVMERGE